MLFACSEDKSNSYLMIVNFIIIIIAEKRNEVHVKSFHVRRTSLYVFPYMDVCNKYI